MSKKHVVVYNRLPEKLVERLREHFTVEVIPFSANLDLFAASAAKAQGLIGASRTLGEKELAMATTLEAIASVSVGYDSYDVDYLTERGILLTNTPDVLTETTADLGFTLLMSAARRVPELDAFVKAGLWRKGIGEEHFGTDIHGRTLGIVGAGRIGAAIAKRGHFGFDMPILYTANSAKPELEAQMGAQRRELDELLQEADFVCLVVPLSAATEKLIGARELGLMKSNAILINLARGAVVDEPALIEALRNGQIRGAGLDVYTQEPLEASPLFELPSVVTLPHIGSATHETRYAMAERAVDNLIAALTGERPTDLVNPAALERR
ncbi:2-hydroxyacid dehydrogenase [Pseudomonas rhizoryzae]|uniref:2-hydroxyacid dehydrogenase n=1 Tax=Pseudomonas rhizoryzae TaxID=2571129 RepID=UPI0007373751|nr:D-glycerate dehydrogenase [Pseudomonas rhizoryzae]KTT33345.1 bifunctional glyoxylate/hydroxypyruvate reductase B [Pseudomonas psychrotolerans]KTT33450.1 bifunctional glyoxylate/hydroxypyruvate reductase B [Pseudomonas psychrotolerans]KTT73313.1 bifunctional glyoxylate/hydroxypyruvate reductase B [Pseudomonas psychrotolerans]